MIGFRCVLVGSETKPDSSNQRPTAGMPPPASSTDASPTPKQSLPPSTGFTTSLQTEAGYTALLEAPHLDGWREHGIGGGAEITDGVVTLKPKKNFSGT